MPTPPCRFSQAYFSPSKLFFARLMPLLSAKPADCQGQVSYPASRELLLATIQSSADDPRIHLDTHRATWQQSGT